MCGKFRGSMWVILWVCGSRADCHIFFRGYGRGVGIEVQSKRQLWYWVEYRLIYANRMQPAARSICKESLRQTWRTSQQIPTILCKSGPRALQSGGRDPPAFYTTRVSSVTNNTSNKLHLESQIVSDVVEKNIDSSKSNPLRRRGNKHDAST